MKLVKIKNAVWFLMAIINVYDLKDMYAMHQVY